MSFCERVALFDEQARQVVVIDSFEVLEIAPVTMRQPPSGGFVVLVYKTVDKGNESCNRWGIAMRR